MTIPLRCRCGQVQGEVGTANTYVRATCYCKDCRAFAQWLGTPGLLDDAGGVDLVAMAPSQVRFTAGEAHIACMTLTPRGIYRWYADCCRTPLGNTFGPAGRCVINTESATAPVRKTPLAFVLGGLRILAGILGAKLRGRRESPFFDAATGAPIRVPVLRVRDTPTP